MKENATMDTLPIDVRGTWYEVPVPVHLHVIGMRENVRIATEHPANAVRRALLRFVETTEDEGTTDLPRDVLDGLVAFGYLTRRRAGRHGYYYEMTPAGETVVTGQEGANDVLSRAAENPDTAMECGMTYGQESHDLCRE